MKEQLAKAREATQTELQHTREKIRNDYEAAQKNEQLMGAALEEQKQKLFGSNEAGVKLALLQRDAAANNDLYEQVVKRVRTGNVMAGAGESEITMIDPATVPSRPSEPHFGLNLAGGIFIGALCGFAMCGILEGLDGKIGTLSDVAELCPLPGVGLIPRLDEREPEAGAPNAAARARIAVLDAPQSSTADAYRSLRSALLHSNGAAVPQIVMVAGPRAGEGATECSANLAVSLAQRNERVLLVDADLRHATLSRWLRMQGDGGLVAALNEQAVAPSLRPLPDLPALQVLSAGRPQANSADMLDSAAMRQLLAVWRTQFDYIVLDAPHVLDLSDAVVLSTLADTSVMVVRAGSGRRSDVRRVKAIFDGVGSHLSGAVVTDVRVSTVEPLREEVGHA
jgi:capsular exopolysaccharide synthesis family protein